MKNKIVIAAIAWVVIMGCSTQQSPFPVISVETYLNEMLDIMQEHHVNKNSIDWPTLRAAVQQKGANAANVSQANESVLLALELLNDQTSFVITALGQGLTYIIPCTDDTPPTVTIPAGIGYIKVPPVNSTGVSAAVFAEKMHGQIRDQDNVDLKGWIIDLRENTGGNMWPMIAAIGPILGNGTTGYFIDSNGGKKTIGYKDGAATYNDAAVVSVSFPYTLVSPNSKVAILMDSSTTNAAEAVVVSFIGKANTRTFGATTCGKGGGNQAYPLSEGSVLYLTIAYLEDRNEVDRRGVITPDEVITDQTLIFQKAVDWINQ